MTVRFGAGGAPQARALAAWRYVSDGTFRTLMEAQLHDLQAGLCYICLLEFIDGHRARDPLVRTKDHVFPRRTGGGRASNVLLAHRLCNEDKNDRWPTPCEVIYLAAIYTEPRTPQEAARRRTEAAAARLERGRRRRAKIYGPSMVSA